MPIRVKSVEDSKKSMTEASTTIGARYGRGIVGADWHTPAASDDSEQLYADKVTKAAQDKLRKKALDKLTNTDWLTPASGKGARNIGSGFSGGIDKWGKNTGPYLEAMRAVELPKKTADGKQNLLNRAGAVVDANIAKKKELSGAS